MSYKFTIIVPDELLQNPCNAYSFKNAINELLLSHKEKTTKNIEVISQSQIKQIFVDFGTTLGKQAAQRIT